MLLASLFVASGRQSLFSAVLTFATHSNSASGSKFYPALVGLDKLLQFHVPFGRLKGASRGVLTKSNYTLRSQHV